MKRHIRRDKLTPLFPCFYEDLEVKFDCLLIDENPVDCANNQRGRINHNALAHAEAEPSSLCTERKESSRCAMEAREARGLEIAANSQITRNGNLWIVPSQSSGRQYTVDLSITPPRCTCPDYEPHIVKCKHIYAVEYLLRRESGAKLSTPEKVIKRQYPPQWHEYNQAATREKTHFQHLLYELCRNLQEPPPPKLPRGRPPLPLSDIVFSGAFKVYTKFPGRDFTADIKQAYARGYISAAMHHNSISRYLEQSSITPHLHRLIERSSLPLLELETVAAVDSTGFSTSRFARWLDAKYKNGEEHREWLKLHALVGVRTNVIVCAEVTDACEHDYHHFKPLIDKARAPGFKFEEVCADKGYIGGKNLLAALLAGMRPYIPFKSNAVAGADKSSVWNNLLHEYRHQQEEFKRHYHQRSNVETTFSMIKAKFDERLRSKTKGSQINEILLKVLCHNIRVLVHSMYEFGLDFEGIFRAEVAPAAKIIPFPHF
jgi:transposase